MNQVAVDSTIIFNYKLLNVLPCNKQCGAPKVGMLPNVLAVCHTTCLYGHMVQFPTSRAESVSNDIVV